MTIMSELKKVSSTYSGSFTGYVIQYGIQVILFQTFDRSELESLCKEYSVSFSNILVEENYHCHKIYRFKL